MKQLEATCTKEYYDERYKDALEEIHRDLRTAHERMAKLTPEIEAMDDEINAYPEIFTGEPKQASEEEIKELRKIFGD